MTNEFSNGLNPAQTERLALLMEEMSEACVIIGKILRHGLSSFNPDAPDDGTNTIMLERELGDVSLAMRLLSLSGEIQDSRVRAFMLAAKQKKAPYLHHATNRILIDEVG